MADNTVLVENLKEHVFYLSETIGDRSVFRYAALEKTVEYISERLAHAGYHTEFQDFTVQGKNVKNIIATKQGNTHPDEILIVGAHYDTCFNPGADDNASAVAGLLELAAFCADKSTDRTITFVAFVNEEPPFYKTGDMGSRVFAKATRKRGEDIRGALILEMIGSYSDKRYSQQYPPLLGFFYPDRADFIAVVSNVRSRSLLKTVMKTFKEHSNFPIESAVTFGHIAGADFSDHWSFWKEGYPALMITDTAFYRYPYYHSQNDTYEKLDYVRMAEVVRAFGHVLLHLANER